MTLGVTVRSRSTPSVARRRWTLAEDQVLVDHYRLGSSSHDIAAAMRRTRSSIWRRALYLGITKPGGRRDPAKIVLRRSQTLRECLSCGYKFASEWIGNRICSRCKDELDM
jgi:predicted Zn-ribbon and HTH transcriptional regulator